MIDAIIQDARTSLQTPCHSYIMNIGICNKHLVFNSLPTVIYLSIMTLVKILKSSIL